MDIDSVLKPVGQASSALASWTAPTAATDPPWAHRLKPIRGQLRGTGTAKRAPAAVVSDVTRTRGHSAEFRRAPAPGTKVVWSIIGCPTAPLTGPLVTPGASADGLGAVHARGFARGDGVPQVGAKLSSSSASLAENSPNVCTLQ